MRKYVAILVVVVVAFALTAIAQTTSSSGQAGAYGTQPNTGTSQSSPSSDGQSNAAGQNTSGTYRTSPSEESKPSSVEAGKQASTMEKGKEKTLEGCVIREETDYFLVPKRGNPVYLSSAGAANLSEHVGHHVKVHGKSASYKASAQPAGGTSGAATSQTTPSTKPEPSGTSGAVAGAMSEKAGAAGTTTATGPAHSAADREITVERVDMVSESCPANWNKKWSSEISTSSSGSMEHEKK
ncbi:MAG: hypothetical protein ACE14M_09775 [Terriglobales bacterium]